MYTFNQLQVNRTSLCSRSLLFCFLLYHTSRYPYKKHFMWNLISYMQNLVEHSRSASPSRDSTPSEN